MKIYRSVIRSIMTYALEIRNETFKTMPIESIQWCLHWREILNNFKYHTLEDRIINQEIRRQSDIQDKFIKERRKQWSQYENKRQADTSLILLKYKKPQEINNREKLPKRWTETYRLYQHVLFLHRITEAKKRGKENKNIQGKFQMVHAKLI